MTPTGRRWAVLLALLLPASAALPAVATAAADPAGLVAPLAGTERGGTFPGATVPFGMVQYSPNTDGALGGGYRYSDPRTWGFATTHLSGPGCPAMGDVVTLPTIGAVGSVATHDQESTFSHASEAATPGYYAATLDASGVRAELTATTHTGWSRFTFPATPRANVLVDPGANFRGAAAVQVRVVGDRTIEGSVSSYGFWEACPAPGANHYTVYFSETFDRPFAAFGTGNGRRLHPGSRSAAGAGAGAYATFDATADPRPLVAKVGISYVDLAGARRNLASETGTGFDFDATRARARAAWNGLLGRIALTGGTAAHRATFTTALYHALLHPNVFSDVDGRYTGFDDAIHDAGPGHAHFTDFSMWDTYRTVHPLIDLVAPEVVGDMVRSLLDDQRESGWLPKWPYAHFETDEMIGDPAANVISDAVLKGLLIGGDAPRAYAAMVHNATDVPDPSTTPIEGRTGLAAYINRGFVPYSGSGDDRFSGSETLEYAIDDCALALVAGKLGHRADHDYLLRRSKRYRHSIDDAPGSARARAADGSWRSPFDPASRSGFKEGSAEQYTWLAPQDVAGLAGTLGGTANAMRRLDAFFGYPAVLADPGRPGPQWRAATRYTPRNEEDLQAPYLYDYLGAPSRTQDIVSTAENMYSTRPAGIPGSDDLGSLSAWYVLSALGLYPVMGGDDHYALTAPLFDRAVIAPPARFYPGGPIVIDAPGAGGGHIQSASLNGRPLETSVISHAALRHGAHLAFVLGSSATPTWATGAATPSSACAINPPTPDVRLGLYAARAGLVRTTLHNTGDAPAGAIEVHLRLPRGWSAHAVGRPPRTLASGASAGLVWRVRSAGGTGTVRADVSWSGPAGSGAALRSFATRAVVPGR